MGKRILQLMLRPSTADDIDLSLLRVRHPLKSR